MKGLWSRSGRSIATLSSLYYRSAVFFHVPVFPVVIWLIRDSSPSGPSHFVADREVGLRPLITVVTCRLLVGMSRLDGIGEGAQMDGVPIASYPVLPLPVTGPNHSPVYPEVFVLPNGGESP